MDDQKLSPRVTVEDDGIGAGITILREKTVGGFIELHLNEQDSDSLLRWLQERKVGSTSSSDGDAQYQTAAERTRWNHVDR